MHEPVGFFERWFFATAGGILASSAVALLIEALLFPKMLSEPSTWPEGGSVFLFIGSVVVPSASVLALLQSLVLQRYFGSGVDWFAATIAGSTLADLGVYWVESRGANQAGWMNAGLWAVAFLTPAARGLLQWVVLSRLYSRAWLWVLLLLLLGVAAVVFNFMAWTMTVLASHKLWYWFDLNYDPRIANAGYALVWAGMYGALSAALSGLLLVRLPVRSGRADRSLRIDEVNPGQALG
jgi:hypothetical protein